MEERAPRRSVGALNPKSAEYQREYIRRHPEKRQQWEITAARKKLEQAGFIVIPPDQQKREA